VLAPGRGPRAAAGGAAVVLAAVLCATAAWSAWGRADSDHAHDRSAGGATTSERDPAAPVVPARRAGAPRSEVPTRSVLPNGTVVPIRPVDTARDGRLAVPEDVKVAGWWRGGSRLGDPFGSTLLAAHVDSFTQGLGPYASLLSVQPGQQITVSSTHLTQDFAVVSLALVPRGTLARHPRFFSARGPRRLTLVTCAGPYLPTHGGYQNLAVITARPVDAVGRRGAP
jgi:Sortase domain